MHQDKLKQTDHIQVTDMLKLHQGVKWHNKPPVQGREFTSADVKATFEGWGKGALAFFWWHLWSGWRRCQNIRWLFDSRIPIVVVKSKRTQNEAAWAIFSYACGLTYPRYECLRQLRLVLHNEGILQRST